MRAYMEWHSHRMSLTASINGRSSAIVTRCSRAAVNTPSTNIDMSPEISSLRRAHLPRRSKLCCLRCSDVIRPPMRAGARSATKNDAQGGEDPGGRQREAAETQQKHSRELDSRVHIILDYDLKTKRGVTK